MNLGDLKVLWEIMTLALQAYDSQFQSFTLQHYKGSLPITEPAITFECCDFITHERVGCLFFWKTLMYHNHFTCEWNIRYKEKDNRNNWNLENFSFLGSTVCLFIFRRSNWTQIKHPLLHVNCHSKVLFTMFTSVFSMKS